jgi:hypothetical protein
VTTIMRHIWVPVLVVLMGLGALIGNYGAELGLPTPVLLLGLTLAVAFGGERFVRWILRVCCLGDFEMVERAIQGSPVARPLRESQPPGVCLVDA